MPNEGSIIAPKDWNVGDSFIYALINGGITSTDQIKNHLRKVDGVMIGRSVYHSPYFLADIEKDIYSNENIYNHKLSKYS